MTEAATLLQRSGPLLPASFSAWRDSLQKRGVPPVVAVAGSRGKSTVVHLLSAMLATANIRVATWTDEGVRIRDKRQQGELLPWSRALSMAAQGDVDLAIQELDWDTVHAVGLPSGAYPVVGITNLCGNSEACLVRPATMRAVKALKTIRDAAGPDAAVALNGDDWAVAGAEIDAHGANHILVSISRDTPLARAHTQRNGLAAWVEDGQIIFGSDLAHETLLPISDIALTMGGRVGFQTTNVLVAVALARSVGLSDAPIAEALRLFTADPARLPGSFNFVEINGAMAIVDQAAPPWFLRQPLRAIGHLPGQRQVRVVGRLAGISDEELVETGRLLGRGSSLVIVHSEAGSAKRRDLLLHGLSGNDVPPAIVQTKSETAALTALLKVLRPDDATYILADDPSYVLRRLQRVAKIDGSTA